MNRFSIYSAILAAFSLLCIALLPGCTEKEGIVRPDEEPDLSSGLWTIQIDYNEDVLQGHFHDIDLTLTRCSTAIGGFDLLLGYDGAALAFAEAELGQHLADCGWEYFSYRYSWNGNCGDSCPSGLIRLIGIAETNNGPNHPDYGCIADAGGERLVTLTFFVSNDRTLECTTQPVRFYWQDCGDNSISTANGDSLVLNDIIIDLYGDSIGPNSGAGLPGYFGVPDDPCLQDDRYNIIRGANFINGAIDIVCSDSLNGGRIGDITGNGISFEVADAVMFANYFLYGLDAFEGHVEYSIEASDCNANGIYLEAADLAYLVRVIVGDALPYPKPDPDPTAVLSFQDYIVTLESTDDVGVVLLVFNVAHPAATPTLLADDMDMKYALNGDELRVLIFNIGSELIPLGQTDILSYQGPATLVDAEVAAYVGVDIPVSIVAAVSKTGPRNTRK